VGVASRPPAIGYAYLIRGNNINVIERIIHMAKNKITVDVVSKKSESKMTFESTRQLFGWLVRNPAATVGADAKGNWFIKVK